MFEGDDGFWHYKCFVCDTQGGDEIAFLVKHLGISRREAIKLYLEMAGFPPSRPPKSCEYPQSLASRKFPPSRRSPESPESPECLGYPMSNGQGLDGEVEKELQRLAASNACTERSIAKKRLWKLLRDVRAVDERIGRKLSNRELMPAFDEWHRLSQPFLDPAKTRDGYLAKFFAGLEKVRVPTGDGDTIKKALEGVWKLAPSELPMIPGCENAPESWRRIAALHRELSRLCGNGIYFLSYRDAAKAYDGLSHQSAYTITFALARLGVIKIVRIGDVRPNGRASEFRYLLSETENRVEEDAGFEL